MNIGATPPEALKFSIKRQVGDVAVIHVLEMENSL
jgi:hypothetical protein